MRIALAVLQGWATVRQPVRDKAYPLVRQHMSRCIVFRRIQDEHPLQVFLSLECRCKFFPGRRVLHQQDPDRGILHDVGHVVRAVIGIQRHHHQTIAQCRLVVKHPFLAVVQMDRDPLTRRQPLRRQRRRPARDLLADLPPADVAPVTGRGIVTAVGQRIGCAPDPLAHQAVQRACIFGGDNVFSHQCHSIRFPVIVGSAARLACLR